ncbi:MAG: hypothetical protein HY701_07445 [Gemmatimonadetes bacterium]|nr:hypothetical protein [Gemmatimonadota bacterium]
MFSEPRQENRAERYRTPAKVIRRNALILLASVLGTFAVLRLLLRMSPDADFNIGPYNIHHLFTGVALMTVGGVPLAIFRGHTAWLDAALVVFGAGLALALDEVVYLIATGGTNAEYLKPVSLWGGVVMVGLASVYAVALATRRLRRHHSAGPAEGPAEP